MFTYIVCGKIGKQKPFCLPSSWPHQAAYEFVLAYFM